jgi:hypothetical protein
VDLAKDPEPQRIFSKIHYSNIHYLTIVWYYGT